MDLNQNETSMLIPKPLFDKMMEKMDRLEYKLDHLLSKKNEGIKIINGEECVTEADAAKRLGIARPTLSAWKARGKITFYKPDGSNKSYYKLKDILAVQTGVKYSSNKEIDAQATDLLLQRKREGYKGRKKKIND